MDIFRWKNILKILFITIIFADKSAGIDNLLIVAGDPDKPYYGDASLRAMRSVKERFPLSTYSVIIGGVRSEFDWSFAPNLIVAPTPAELEFAIAEDFKKHSQGKSNLTFLTDHGNSPEDKFNPSSAGISTVGLKALTYDRLEHATSSAPLAKQTDSYDRFISMLCYGGAFHESAFKNPNTCALTSSDWSHITWGLKFNNAAFEEIRRPKFDINNDGQTNLMETLLRVLIEDDQNFPMQQTSSMAFVDSILKEGAYSPDSDRQELGVNVKYAIPTNAVRNQFESEYRIMAAQASPVCANPAPEALEIVNQVNEILNSLNETHPLFLSRQEKEKLPRELRDFYEQILKSDQVKKLGENTNKKNFESEMKTLRTEWERTSQKANICSTGTTENSENLTCRQITLQLSNLRRTIANRIELFRSDMQISPASLGNLYPLFLYFKKAAKFIDRATPEQKQTFERLLKCELSSI